MLFIVRAFFWASLSNSVNLQEPTITGIRGLRIRIGSQNALGHTVHCLGHEPISRAAIGPFLSPLLEGKTMETHVYFGMCNISDADYIQIFFLMLFDTCKFRI